MDNQKETECAAATAGAEEELTLEQSLAQLEELVDRLGEEECGLEKAFGLYQKGMELVLQCNNKIDKVEKQVQMLDEEGTLHDF